MKNKGFTLIELMVTVTIMMIMTSVVLFNYNKFNEGTLLNTFAYDMSLTIRQAQVYGVAVREAPGANQVSQIDINTGNDPNFSSPYGVHFDSSANATNPLVLFIDSGGVTVTANSGDRIFNKDSSTQDVSLQSFTFQRGIKISGLCVVRSPDTTCTPDGSVTTVDITFKRPDPEATFTYNGLDYDGTISSAEIYLSNADGSIKKKVVVDYTGQISVQAVNN